MTQMVRMFQINVTEEEADLLALFREEKSRLNASPDGWEFYVDANPDRMVATFKQKETCKMKRGAGPAALTMVKVNGNGA